MESLTIAEIYEQYSEYRKNIKENINKQIIEYLKTNGNLTQIPISCMKSDHGWVKEWLQEHWYVQEQTKFDFYTRRYIHVRDVILITKLVQ
jgi:hypothetical protein